MSASAPFLNASEAASQLGVSIKALRLYEQQGLVTPGRTAAGYRMYGPKQMDRAGEIVALRALGLSLAQVARVLDGDSRSLATALATHESALNEELQDLVQKLDRIRCVRADLARGQMPVDGELTRLVDRARMSVEFALPWPGGGERFELRDIRPLNYIIGSLGSGKTRLALRLAETLPDAVFLGLDRLQDNGVAALNLLNGDASLKSRVDQAMEWLIDEGATESRALTTLLANLEADGPAALVVDMIEQDLDAATQEALITFLRLRASAGARPLFLMTRSSAILDLAAVGPDEAIILCPANHSAPVRVAPYPGAPGYEAVATCLATPEVRARIARRPEATAGEATICQPQARALRDP
jgi:DNA-binding transcriptional MerR regulator